MNTSSDNVGSYNPLSQQQQHQINIRDASPDPPSQLLPLNLPRPDLLVGKLQLIKYFDFGHHK